MGNQGGRWGQTEEARGTRLALILKTIENHWKFMRKEVWRAVRGRNWSGEETEEGEHPDPMREVCPGL